VYEHDGGNDSVNLEDSSQNFKKWGVEVGDLVTNITDGSTMVVTAIATDSNENDQLQGVLSGGTDNNWDNNDEYKVERRHHVRVGDLVRVKVKDPEYTDADYLVVALRYNEPSQRCELRLAKNLTAPGIGDQQTFDELFQMVQDDGRRALQRGGY
ncbi:hypothetical protein LCGC14_2971770, partial [marine sediment metagenome]